jgi:hypothetical protein
MTCLITDEQPITVELYNNNNMFKIIKFHTAIGVLAIEPMR